MPGKALGFGADMPGPAYWQWRKWCTRDGFFRDQVSRSLPPWRTENLPDQVRLFSVRDDDLIPGHCVTRLARSMNHAQHSQIAPRNHGLEKVGHLGFFARRNAALWPQIFDL